MNILTFWILTVILISFTIYMISRAINLLLNTNKNSDPLDLLIQGLGGTRLVTMFLSFIATIVTGIMWTNYLISKNPDWDTSHKIIFYLDVVSLSTVFSFFLSIVLIRAEQNLGRKLEVSKKNWVIFIVVIYSLLDFTSLVLGGVAYKENFLDKEKTKLEYKIEHLKTKSDTSDLMRSIANRIKEINNILNEKQNIEVPEDAQIKYFKQRISKWQEEALKARNNKDRKTYTRYKEINEKKLAEYITFKRKEIVERLYKERTELFKQLDTLQKLANAKDKNIRELKEKTLAKIESEANDGFKFIVLVALGIVLINILLGYITGKLIDDNKPKGGNIFNPLKDLENTVIKKSEPNVPTAEKVVNKTFTNDDKIEYIKKAMIKLADEKGVFLSPYESYKPNQYFTRDAVMKKAKEIALKETGIEIPLSAPMVMTAIREQHKMPYEYIHKEVEAHIRSKSAEKTKNGTWDDV